MQVQVLAVLLGDGVLATVRRCQASRHVDLVALERAAYSLPLPQGLEDIGSMVQGISQWVRGWCTEVM